MKRKRRFVKTWTLYRPKIEKVFVIDRDAKRVTYTGNKNSFYTVLEFYEFLAREEPVCVVRHADHYVELVNGYGVYFNDESFCPLSDGVLKDTTLTNLYASALAL